MRFLTDTSNGDRSSLGPRLRVICAGLPRCATSSLQAALETPEMGYSPCMHMSHVAPHAPRCQLAVDAINERDTAKRRKILHKLFDGYEATADFPGFWFIDDLMDMYPDAALILNQRKDGGKSWIKSMNDSLLFFGSLTYRVVCFPFKTDRLHYEIHRIAREDFDRKWGVDGFSAEFYDVYQQFVLNEAKKRGREVMIWKAEDGWAPLCRFLNKEAPKGAAFPWINDASQMSLLKKILLGRGIVGWLAIAGVSYASWAYGGSMLRFFTSKLSGLL